MCVMYSFGVNDATRTYEDKNISTSILYRIKKGKEMFLLIKNKCKKVFFFF